MQGKPHGNGQEKGKGLHKVIPGLYRFHSPCSYPIKVAYREEAKKKYTSQIEHKVVVGIIEFNIEHGDTEECCQQ